MDPDRIKGTARNLYGQAEDKIGELAGDAQTRGRGAVDRAAGAAQNAYGRAKDSARDVAEGAPEVWNDALDAGQDYYRQGSRALRDQVGQQPLVALLLAGFFGYLLGWTLHSRN
jgi:uncharacterized protein YjbJ (UPF0337 family)